MTKNTAPVIAAGLPSRRATLTAFASLGAAAAMPKVAESATFATSEIADLAARYAAALYRFRAALDAFNRAEIRLQKPVEPEAIFRQPGDLALFYGSHPGGFYPGGRWWYGDDSTIAGLSRDQALQGAAAARRDDIIDAYDSWHAARRTAEEAAGLTAAEAEFTAADRALDAARLPIVRLRSNDPAAMQLKLRVFADIHERAAYLDTSIEAEIGTNGPGAEALALSIARDLCSFSVNA